MPNQIIPKSAQETPLMVSDLLFWFTVSEYPNGLWADSLTYNEYNNNVQYIKVLYFSFHLFPTCARLWAAYNLKSAIITLVNPNLVLSKYSKTYFFFCFP